MPPWTKQSKCQKRKGPGRDGRGGPSGTFKLAGVYSDVGARVGARGQGERGMLGSRREWVSARTVPVSTIVDHAKEAKYHDQIEISQPLGPPPSASSGLLPGGEPVRLTGGQSW